MKFSELGLSPDVLRALDDSGYVEPTPIQCEAIPAALAGRDVLGIAQTGTGKTAAFTLPILTVLAHGRARARIPRSVILCPTRELAAQVADSFETYGKFHKLNMALLIGGVSFAEQNARIDRGVDVLIATPGRLLDHFERGRLMLTGVQVFVIDEADRMLDMGFIPDVERICRLTPFTRQTMLFSATMPREIERLADEFLQGAVRVEVAPPATTVDAVTQVVVSVRGGKGDRGRARLDALVRALEDPDADLSNAIVFCNRKTTVRDLHQALKGSPLRIAALHGDMDQHQRMATLEAFRNSEVQVLIASDVAARGLDIPTVSHVINFEVPQAPEDYVHRIGRTARAGRTGVAITLCEQGERRQLAQIEKLIGTTLDVIEPTGPGEARKDRRRTRRSSAESASSDTVEAEAEVEAEDESQPAPESDLPPAPAGRRKGSRRSARSSGARESAPLTFGEFAPAFLLRDGQDKPSRSRDAK